MYLEITKMKIWTIRVVILLILVMLAGCITSKKYEYASGELKAIGSEGSIQIKDGKLVLTNFKTSTGSDLHIYLTKGRDVATGKNLGKVNLEKAEQIFDLAGTTLKNYDSVLIYCNKTRAALGEAKLDISNNFEINIGNE